MSRSFIVPLHNYEAGSLQSGLRTSCCNPDTGIRRSARYSYSVDFVCVATGGAGAAEVDSVDGAAFSVGATAGFVAFCESLT